MFLEDRRHHAQIDWIAILSYSAALAAGTAVWVGLIRFVGYLVR